MEINGFPANIIIVNFITLNKSGSTNVFKICDQMESFINRILC